MRKQLILSPSSIIPFHQISLKNFKAFFLVPLLLTAAVAPVLALPDAFGALVPSNLLALGKINPALFGKAFASGSSNVDVLVETRTNNYATLIYDIQRLGGRVTYQYKFLTGLAASLPAAGLLELAKNPEVVSVDPDAIVTLNSQLPQMNTAGLDHLDKTVIPLDQPFEVLDQKIEALGQLEPETYINTVTHGAASLVAQGINGRTSVAAIIDTGIYSGHFMIGRSKIVGGTDVSPDVGTPREGFDDVRNHPHGSGVAGVLGGFARILIPASSLLARSIALHSGQPLPDFPPVPGAKILTLSGIAPMTKFFVVKVFPQSGAGVPTSTVVRGMEAAIDAKVNLNLDIDVMSMSIGGPTLFDGRGLDAQAVHRAVQAGIAVSIAGGNEGPAPMTVADPGASHEAITSAALAHPINTRVAWDLQFGRLGIGSDLFVGSDPQIISFSSRGPTADNRAKPDASAIGVFTLSAFPTKFNKGQGLAFWSGTSFSTPAISGVISLLSDYVERVLNMPDGATPEDYKQAIISTAAPIPGYTPEEQGAGFVDAAAAQAALNPAAFGSSVGPLTPIPQGTTLQSLTDIRNVFLADSPTAPVRTFTTSVTLNPGQNMKFVFETVRGTNSIKVTFTNVQAGTNPNPTAQTAFPNSFEVYIHDAKRGGSGNGFGYYVDSLNVRGDAQFTITEGSTTFSGAVFGLVDPTQIFQSVIEPGFSKVVVEGDWTNGVPVSATVTIEVTFDTLPRSPDVVYTGTIGQFDPATGAGLTIIGPLDGHKGEVLKLYWSPGDYAHFATSDIDLLIATGPGLSSIDPQGATLNSPERVVLANGGKFFVIILGFEVNPPGFIENWELQRFIL